MSIDWSKAPEGTTHFAPPRNGVNPLWAKRQGEYWAYHHISENKEGWYVGVQPGPAEFFIRSPNLPMPPVSEAPDGATHWDPGNRCTATWAMKCDGIWYWHPVCGEAIVDCWSPYSNVVPDPLNFIRIERPWTGEGLPPVGTVCEFKANILGWVQATITAVTELSIVFTRPSYQNGRPLVEERLPHKAIERFRPIRTPEQIAAEDRDKAINQMEFDSGYLDRGAFTKLYDAGWRKQVTP